MPVSRLASLLLLLSAAPLQAASHAAPSALPACRTQVVEGEISAGRPFLHPIGQDLQLVLQPIASGWIVRILPLTANLAQVWQPDFRDYALLATPPYRSVTPLSLSTDFGFRAQDAAGWNPRRFHFATSPQAFRRLNAAYEDVLRHTPAPALAPAIAPASQAVLAAQSALAAQIATTSAGLLKLLDVRLTPGTADQGPLANAVSFSFPQTAHTLVPAGPGVDLARGTLLWVKFRFELEMPAGFRAAPKATLVPHVCGSR